MHGGSCCHIVDSIALQTQKQIMRFSPEHCSSVSCGEPHVRRYGWRTLNAKSVDYKHTHRAGPIGQRRKLRQTRLQSRHRCSLRFGRTAWRLKPPSIRRDRGTPKLLTHGRAYSGGRWISTDTGAGNCSRLFIRGHAALHPQGKLPLHGVRFSCFFIATGEPS